MVPEGDTVAISTYLAFREACKYIAGNIQLKYGELAFANLIDGLEAVGITVVDAWLVILDRNGVTVVMDDGCVRNYQWDKLPTP